MANKIKWEKISKHYMTQATGRSKRPSVRYVAEVHGLRLSYFRQVGVVFLHASYVGGENIGLISDRARGKGAFQSDTAVKAHVALAAALGAAFSFQGSN